MILINIFLTLLLSYLLGSIPTGVIVSKLFFGFDIREKGSGNMGSTNAFRVLGWKWGLIVQVIDIAKGLAAVSVIGRYFGSHTVLFGFDLIHDVTIFKIIAGISAVAGHIWSFWVGFRGGKGVNTATGILIGLIPLDVAAAAVLFILAVIFSGYISLGSIIAAVTVPSSLIVRYNLFGMNIEGYEILLYFTLFVMLLVVYTHRSNIKRLMKGDENKFKKLQLIKIKFLQKKSSDSDREG